MLGLTPGRLRFIRTARRPASTDRHRHRHRTHHNAAGRNVTGTRHGAVAGASRSTQNYLDCLDDPNTTLAYCQQFNPDPSPSPTPTPVQTIPTAPFVVGDCVVVSNSGSDHSLSGAHCTNSHAYRVINVTVGTSNTNYCRSVDPTFATDDVIQFTSNQANRTYCLNPTPGSTGHQ